MNYNSFFCVKAYFSPNLDFVLNDGSFEIRINLVNQEDRLPFFWEML